MKVLDLQCAHGHCFEGWFGSEADFQSQRERTLIQCPMCGISEVEKKLSAPRLNLGSRQEAAPSPSTDVMVPSKSDADLAAVWLAIARHVVANTTDVGHRFAEEARRIHYGEVQEHSIRGKTTPDEARALLDEGIEVLPLLLPEAVKEPLQ